MSFREEQYYASSKESFIKLEKDFKSHEGVDFNEYSSEEDLKKLWHDTLENGMHGLCFSMYEDQQKPGDVITIEQVERRIKIIKPYTKWVRSFSCIEGNEHIPRMAHKHGLKNMVGAWLSDDLEMNESEIEGLIQLAKEGCVDIAAVGNEVLYRNDLSLEQLLGYIKRVKEALPGIPVGYVDAYYEFSKHPELVEVSDVILANCYPYWEGCSIEHSLNHMQQMYGQAAHAANGKKVIITESGWPSKGESLRGAHSSEENAMKYFINAQAWSSKDDIDMFYFSSFDESWKVGAEGVVGAYWGLWDKHEKLKY
ncbi:MULTISPECIES: glycosyl hydrolase family 17 protein [unclassified Polaribacter]|jgi:glucan 1,3-beta-glucosidase|uniref:glycoside hydrolase family 17 protein n=1 Tax=unclassified Polaribacter TaxID=196858 RepID=UPI00052CA357|nr:MULTISPECIES: glycosyl hydrolase family 17 protein [unclassified Polaribacter]KGL61176.1 glucan 1,3-beta-glucosidase, GH17 family [Polaribacter sp. Hel1_33_49]MDG2436132.1 glycosyl hydrolase family 17 protein [Polaribacter sp.]PKV64532.1 exo-beta-1,3-glucanase (GH17 family) [Polaribacter sp. Hel1_33_96]